MSYLPTKIIHQIDNDFSFLEELDKNHEKKKITFEDFRNNRNLKIDLDTILNTPKMDKRRVLILK